MAICARPECNEPQVGNSKYCAVHKELARLLVITRNYEKRGDWEKAGEYLEKLQQYAAQNEIELVIDADGIVPVSPNRSIVPAQPKPEIRVEKLSYKPTKLTGKRLYKFAFDQAIHHALASAKAVQPTPMVVEQHKNLLDDHSPVVQQYIASEGVCGYGYAKFEKANTSFTRWLLQTERASKYYRGGCVVHMHAQTPSYERHKTAAREFCLCIVHYIPAEAKNCRPVFDLI